MTISELAGCVLLSALASLVMLLSRLRAPLGADEGYLWFGVQQVLKGRLPHRDFKSYEPGRYLWSALWARLLGDHLGVLRASTHLLFAIALAVALLVLRELGLGWWSLASAAVALTALSHPLHKQYEHALVLLAWASLTQLLLAPSTTSLACAAAFVGVTLLFGFNVFLYCAAALAVTLAVAILDGALAISVANVGTLVGAGVVGLLPFALFLPLGGFARTFYRRRIGSVLARGQSNLSLPQPWPWRAVPRQLQGVDRAQQRAFQWLHLALIAVPVVVGPLLLALNDIAHAAAAVAACVLGLFLFHNAASRAGPAHILGSAGPLCLLAILGVDALAPLATAMVAALAVWLVWPLQPAVRRRRHPAQFCRGEALGLAIDFRAVDARVLEAVATLCAAGEGGDAAGRDQGAAAPAGLFVAPAYPALYLLLQRDAPAYDTYCVYAADARAQQEMIDGIERAGVFAALVSNAPFDGREELRFARTHPHVWTHLQAHFASQPRPDLGRDVFVLTRAARA